ncbi:MAG: pentapeptide repeat-containing protein [Aphanothece sp. CMT-3BRIN-NPC111]|jgi:predicted NACHT family NTPase|nr:pentapeptide repeat-containing protein [Aphanothece sp. CMT-3BRIN-NPC111]
MDIGKLISAIAGSSAPVLKAKLERSEPIIKLLREHNLDPEHPPADFLGVYAYTLVSYGVGKPEPILKFFREEQIQKAFRQTFEQNDFSILLNEAEDFLDWNILGDELRKEGLDPRREFAEFSGVFIEIAKRTRTPAEVMRDQNLDNVQQDVREILELFKRLPLNEMRTELARLAQRYQALQPAITSTEDKLGAFILAQQMRAWFETLGYSFENYAVEKDEYFEWIINIPKWRGYDRILVRGIKGETQISDVVALHQVVEEQKTDEGLLVAARRISPAARDEVEKPEYRNLLCCTFDELLDGAADFSPYFDWLEAEVKSKGIDKMYVSLSCIKDEFDPVTKQKIGESHYNERDGWIEGYIDKWLDDPAKEHISIVGEFGTGKTWFALHYAWTVLQEYRKAKERGIKRPRLPLLIPLRDYAKALDVNNVVAGFFFNKHNIRLNSAVFDQLNRMGKLLLIFDGFDEMADKVDRQKMIDNFWELSRVVVPGSKAILTCRTEHFPEAQEGRALLNAELKASIANLTGEPPQFEVLKLEYFNDDQIRKVLSFKTNPGTVDQVMGNPQLLDLARRPVMTELILEALPDIEAGKPVDMSRVYLYAVRHKMERDIKAERTFTSLADKLYFLCELSWEMLSTDQMSLNYRLFPDRLRRLFGHAVQEQKDLDHWRYDMLGQTMLIRNDDGDYTPAHRSLLEFFVAYKFAAELGILAPDFTELAQAQLPSNLDTTAPPQNYTWSSYFRREVDEKGAVKLIPPLEDFVTDEISRLAETVGKQPLTKAIRDLLKNMLVPNREEVKTQLLAIIDRTRGKTTDEVGVTGGNVATILVRYNPLALKGLDLSGTNLSHADLSGANLTESILSSANLSHINLRKANLTECQLPHADLSHVCFKKTVMVGAMLQKSNLHGIDLGVIEGWIGGMPVLNTKSWIYFYYSELGSTPQSPELPFNVENNEIVIGLKDNNVEVEKNTILEWINESNKGNLKWTQRIKSPFIVSCCVDIKRIQILTVDGEVINLDVENGQPIFIEDICPLLQWHGADLAGTIGLDERNAYFIKILGAINTPTTAYDPRHDPKVVLSLRVKSKGRSDVD